MADISATTVESVVENDAPVRRPRPPKIEESQWEAIRPRFYQLYVVRRETLETCRGILTRECGFQATPRKFKLRIQKWGYERNITRRKLSAVLEDIRSSPSGPNSIGTTLTATKVRNYIGRNKLTRLSPRYQLLLKSPTMRTMDEVLLQDVYTYINCSFADKLWCFNGDDRLVESSESQEIEKYSLDTLVTRLQMGRWWFERGHRDLAEAFWQDAFRQTDLLVRGTYHDNLPNITRQISDLVRLGFFDLATMLRDHTAARAMACSAPSSKQHKMFGILSAFDLRQFCDLDNAIAQIFSSQFEKNLPNRCYNSFVMYMDQTQRKLQTNEQVQPLKYLPSLSQTERTFGYSDRRSMDIIRVQMETAYDRRRYAEAIVHANDLIRRAETVENDEWIQIYFLLHGLYFLGSSKTACSQDSSVNTITAGEEAINVLKKFLEIEARFTTFAPGYLFRNQRLWVYDALEQVTARIGHEEGAANWRAHKFGEAHTVSALVAFTN